MDFIAISIIISIVGFLFAFWQARQILKIEVVSAKVREISDAIRIGAMAFLGKLYQALAWYVLVVAILLWFFIGHVWSFAFVVGCIFSALSGNIGMRIATRANGRTITQVEKSMTEGLKVAFSSGMVMGLTVTSMGLFGVAMLYLIFKSPDIIYGFSLGASSIALFARVGGGIYTKGADVGAD